MARVFVDSQQVSIEMKKFAFRLCAGILTFTIGVTVAALCRDNDHQIPGIAVSQIVSVAKLQVRRSGIVRPPMPVGWNKVTADGLFAFYLPKNMKVSSNVMSEEAAWGRSFSNSGIRLYAEYSSWEEGYAAAYLAKQFEYEKERIELDGRKALVHSWRWAEPASSYKHEAEFRIYDAKGKMLVRMSADCRDHSDVELAKRIFMTVQFP
jgi:hypothetical protein